MIRGKVPLPPVIDSQGKTPDAVARRPTLPQLQAQRCKRPMRKRTQTKILVGARQREPGAQLQRLANGVGHAHLGPKAHGCIEYIFLVLVDRGLGCHKGVVEIVRASPGPGLVIRTLATRRQRAPVRVLRSENLKVLREGQAGADEADPVPVCDGFARPVAAR